LTRLICTITIWLYVPQLNKTLPHTAKTTCKVIEVIEAPRSEWDSVIGRKTYVDVDCSDKLGWLVPKSQLRS